MAFIVNIECMMFLERYFPSGTCASVQFVCWEVSLLWSPLSGYYRERYSSVRTGRVHAIHFKRDMIFPKQGKSLCEFHRSSTLTPIFVLTRTITSNEIWSETHAHAFLLRYKNNIRISLEYIHKLNELKI